MPLLVLTKATMHHPNAHNNVLFAGCRLIEFQIKLDSFGGTNLTRFCGSGGALESNATCVFTVLDLEKVKSACCIVVWVVSITPACHMLASIAPIRLVTEPKAGIARVSLFTLLVVEGWFNSSPTVSYRLVFVRLTPTVFREIDTRSIASRCFFASWARMQGPIYTVQKILKTKKIAGEKSYVQCCRNKVPRLTKSLFSIPCTGCQ